MDALRTLLMVLVALIPIVVPAQAWKMQPVSIQTRWAATVTPANAWPEYPRPQMQRVHWMNLNGLWEYAITAREAPMPEKYAGQILVPYPVESALSGVKRSLQPDQLLWYRRTIIFTPGRSDERVLLHFGAVDYEATVYLNGKQVGVHRGGYQSFTFEITGGLRAAANELVVKVYDPTDKGPNSHGKQSLRPEFMTYGASSGIWQTVWLERVPSTHIRALKLTPDLDRGELRLEVDVDGKGEGYITEAIAKSADKVVARSRIEGSGSLRIKEPRLWSPDDPHLYDLYVRLLKHGRVIDEVKSYFGMRKIYMEKDGHGRARVHLNNRYTYNLGVVDQGYWPDGLYTAPSDAALEFDVKAVKALGFNAVRKHIKIEPQRWYYHCDRLGLMVWQDMPAAKNDTRQARDHFEQEIKENLAQLHNHPSITIWVLFNEGWGAYDQERLAKWMMQADRSRLLIGHSGPYDQLRLAQWLKRLPPSQLLGPLGGGGPVLDDLQNTQHSTPANWMAGNIADMHFYPGPNMFPAQAEMASVLGEHGSFGVYVEGHVWDELSPVGGGMGASRMVPQQMLEAYAESTRKLAELEQRGLSGSAYFEVFDVEGEQQGFLTYDREVAKVPVHAIERINATLVPRALNYAQATSGFMVMDADRTLESQRYERLVKQFQNGERDLAFLRRLALTAWRQDDAVQATQAADAFIDQAPRPYDKETWRTTLAITRTSNDAGFNLLRTRSDEINALLGPQAAQRKIQEIITRERIAPYFQDQQRSLDWEEFEQSVAAQYGELGKEAVYGAKMMDELTKEEWVSFGNSFILYFSTALPRSPYMLHSLCYRVLTHVENRKAIETAITVMKWRLDAPREVPVFGRYDPIEIDTYANLLHKAGRAAEALEWQQKAVLLSDGRDQEVMDNLRRMYGEALTSNTTGAD